MKVENMDLVDHYLSNRRKSEIWSYIWTLVFLVLAGLIVYLIINNKNLQKDRASLQVSNADLQLLVNELRETNDSLLEARQTVSNITQLNDTLTKANALLVTALYKIDSSISAIAVDPATPAPPVDNVDLNSKPEREKTEDIKKLSYRIKTNPELKRITTDSKKIYTVFIQCMPGYEKDANRLKKALTNYKIMPWEVIKSTSFNNQVKYFHAQDTKEAESLVKTLNETLDPAIPFHATLSRMKAPERQLEIWMGEYEKPTNNVDYYIEKARKNSIKQ